MLNILGWFLQSVLFLLSYYKSGWISGGSQSFRLNVKGVQNVLTYVKMFHILLKVLSILTKILTIYFFIFLCNKPVFRRRLERRQLLLRLAPIRTICWIRIRKLFRWYQGLCLDNWQRLKWKNVISIYWIRIRKLFRWYQGLCLDIWQKLKLTKIKYHLNLLN